jgi:hypothetical protein
VPGLPEPPLIRRRIAAVLAAGVLLAAGCGGDSKDDEGKLELPPGFNLQLFNCSDWNAADKPLRAYVLSKLHTLANDQITGPGVQGRGSVLTDKEAMQFFDNRCRDPRARGFVLYKIYAFARGFRGSTPPGS